VARHGLAGALSLPRGLSLSRPRRLLPGILLPVARFSVTLFPIALFSVTLFSIALLPMTLVAPTLAGEGLAGEGLGGGLLGGALSLIRAAMLARGAAHWTHWTDWGQVSPRRHLVIVARRMTPGDTTRRDGVLLWHGTPPGGGRDRVPGFKYSETIDDLVSP